MVLQNNIWRFLDSADTQNPYLTGTNCSTFSEKSFGTHVLVVFSFFAGTLFSTYVSQVDCHFFERKKSHQLHRHCVYMIINTIVNYTCSSTHAATHCNALQHTATYCNSLQHTATYCNTEFDRDNAFGYIN